MAKFKSNRICSVYGCSNRCDIEKKISLHKFPKMYDLRKKWSVVLRMGSVPLNAYACSEHFQIHDFIPSKGTGLVRRLKKIAIPSRNLPKRKLDKSPGAEKKRKIIERHERYCQRLLFQELSDTRFSNLLMNKENDIKDAENTVECPNISKFSNISEPANEILELRIQDKSVQVELLTFVYKATVMDIINSDASMLRFTGLPTIQCFKNFCETIEYALVSSLFTQYISKKLDLQNQIMLTLIKLRHNLPFNFLADLFNISPPTCSTLFFKTINILRNILEQFIEWPTRESINKNIPHHFFHFPKTGVVLDCTEVPVSIPSCLSCRVRLYSYYKSCYTIKFMVGIAPSGVITFISNIYGGRASDKYIFNHSKLLELCDFDDCIMVDRGFLIEEECASHGIQIIRPPFVGNKKQLSIKEAQMTKYIARARVHVERIIQRIKNFRILSNKIQFSLLKVIDSIVIVICALVNLSTPILKDTSF